MSVRDFFGKSRKEDNSSRNVIWQSDINITGSQNADMNTPMRQRNIKMCKVGEAVSIEPAPLEGNPDIIGVFTELGLQIGVLPDDIVGKLKEKYTDNPTSAVISSIRPYGGGLACYITLKIFEK